MRSSIWRWNSPAICVQVVADVAQVGARAAASRPSRSRRSRRERSELVVLGGDEPVQLVHVLLEPVAAGELLAARRGRGPSASSASTRVLDRVDDRVERVGQRVEHAVDEVAPRLCGLARPSVSCSSSSDRAVVAAHRDHEAAGEVDVDLERLARARPGRRSPAPSRRRAAGGRRRGRASAAGRTRACPPARPGAGRAASPSWSISSSPGVDEVDPEELVALLLSASISLVVDAREDVHRFSDATRRGTLLCMTRRGALRAACGWLGSRAAGGERRTCSPGGGERAADGLAMAIIFFFSGIFHSADRRGRRSR